MEADLYQLIVHAPLDAADAIREAAANAGAGAIGEYDHCSFSVHGTGRFRGSQNANPTVGTTGTVETVQEERIEMVVTSSHLSPVLRALRSAHPYEEPSIHVLPMMDYKRFL